MEKFQGWTKKERLSFIKYFKEELQNKGLESLLEAKGSENCGWVIFEVRNYLGVISKNKNILEATIYDRFLENPIVDSITKVLNECGVNKIFYYSDLRRALG